MKILTNRHNFEYICECSYCNTTFSFVKNEAELMWGNNGNPDYLRVYCPKCKEPKKVAE